MERLWHPFADMATIESGGQVVIDRGEGPYVWDEQGKRYLDAIASLWYCNVGYGREEIVEAVKTQMSKLPAYHIFNNMANRPALELADRLAALAPVRDARVFLASGGSDAIETAAKMVRRYWRLHGSPEKTTIVVREQAYHGMHAYGTALAGIEVNRTEHGSIIPDTVLVPWDSVEAVADAIDMGRGKVGAVFCEPVIGVGGVFSPPEGYLKQLRQLCADKEVLFVADEVITGFGRLGDWFASTRLGLDPDIITFAKGVTSGYLPLGGVIASGRVAEPFWREGEIWHHGYTYSGHATACAAALANLDIMEREGLDKVALTLENDMAELLSPLTEHPAVTEVRAGLGVLAAVQLDAGLFERDPGLKQRAYRAALDAGVISRIITGYAYQVSPALIISRQQIGDIASGLLAAVEAWH